MQHGLQSKYSIFLVLSGLIDVNDKDNSESVWSVNKWIYEV